MLTTPHPHHIPLRIRLIPRTTTATNHRQHPTPITTIPHRLLTRPLLTHRKKHRRRQNPKRTKPPTTLRTRLPTLPTLPNTPSNRATTRPTTPRPPLHRRPQPNTRIRRSSRLTLLQHLPPYDTRRHTILLLRQTNTQTPPQPHKRYTLLAILTTTQRLHTRTRLHRT